MESKKYRETQEYADRLKSISEEPEKQIPSQNEHVDQFLDQFPEYWNYISSWYPDLPEHPYLFFGILTDFIAKELKTQHIPIVKRVLQFLEQMLESKDQQVIDLLRAGCLECFDLHKDILPGLVELMPSKLKNDFLKYFGDYLKN